MNKKCGMRNAECGRSGNRAVPALFIVIVLISGTPAFAQEHAGHGKAMKEAASPKQTSSAPIITLSAEKRQLIGVRTAIVERKTIDRRIRTVGKVEVDETKLAFVNTKVSGWVKKLFIASTGQAVVKGQPLLSLYSPDLVSAQEEYLLAFRAVRTGATGGAIPEISASQRSLLESAKRRLLLWDITEEQIAELERTDAPRTDMTVFAPLDGIVLEKMVLEGAYVVPGMNLYRIADLSRIWVLADVYEYEVPLIHTGEAASVTLSYDPGRVVQASVSYIYPTLDPMTRTVKVRLVMQNPGLIFKPEMFANVEIAVSPGARLVIPTEAVLDSGTRQIVYVEKQEGVYEMRQVKLGVRGDKYVEALSGVHAGEKVVTSGNFLIDSESQLRLGQ